MRPRYVAPALRMEVVRERTVSGKQVATSGGDTMGIDDTTAPAAALGIDHSPPEGARRGHERPRRRNLSGPWVVAALAVWAAAFLGGLAAAALAGAGDPRSSSADAATDSVAEPAPATTSPAGQALPATTTTVIPPAVPAAQPVAPEPAEGRGAKPDKGKDEGGEGEGRSGKGNGHAGD